jgi:hypothetical protein
MVVMMMMFVGLRPRTIGSWLSYEMWDSRSVNRVYVDNLGLPGISETLSKFWWKFRWTFIWELYKKNYPYFYVPNRRKITINAYESMGHYTNTPNILTLLRKLPCDVISKMIFDGNFGGLLYENCIKKITRIFMYQIVEK